ncbi:MAG: glycosyltransferase [Verrucomicrobiota bacterium]
MSERGHEIACLCMAELSLRPWMHWKRTDERFSIYHLYNGGVYPGVYPQGGVGTRSPQLEIDPSIKLRRLVFQIIHEFSPDLISIQSLFGLPLRMMEEIAQGPIPTVFTALDYFSICPTAHLFPPEEKPCRLPAQQLTCDQCCSQTLHYVPFWVTHHFDQWIDHCSNPSFLRSTLCRLRNIVIRVNRLWNKKSVHREGYIRRREIASESLKSLTVIQPISHRQAEVLQELTGRLSNIRVIHAHPVSTTKITSQPLPSSTQRPLRFVALNVHAPYKGSELLNSVFRELEKKQYPFELHFYGARPENTISSSQVHYHGRYQESDLDSIGSDADFLLIPSLWDETLGFVGLEMMARGVPLIVSQLAGVSEFVKNWETGFIFDPHQKDSLLQIIEELFQNESLRQKIQQNASIPNESLKTFDQHVTEIEEMFRGAVIQKASN